jgi:hypothetical protein
MSRLKEQKRFSADMFTVSGNKTFVCFPPLLSAVVSELTSEEPTLPFALSRSIS